MFLASIIELTENPESMRKLFSLLIVLFAIAMTDLQAQLNVELKDLQHVTCAGLSNGNIQVEVTGGSEPYTYSWSANTQNAPYLGNLSGGTFFLTVSDASGASVNKVYIVNEPETLLAYFTESTIDNGSCNGVAELIISGGSTPYKYQGTTMNSNTLMDGLCEGVKIMTIRDAAGCVSTASCRVATE